jgi:hypothetical protein
MTAREDEAEEEYPIVTVAKTKTNVKLIAGLMKY